MSAPDPASTAPERRPSVALPATLLAAVLGVWGVVALREPVSVPHIAAPDVAGPALALPSTAPRPAPDPRAVFDERVEPLLAASSARHAAAIERTLELVELEFRSYRNGVEPFVRDLTSLGTRGGVLLRSARDWFSERESVAEYVSAKFDRHLFTDAELAEFLELAARSTLDAFEADRNKLLRDVELALSETELPALQLPDYAEFAAATSLELERFATDIAGESARAGVGTLVAAEAAAVLATQLLSRAVPLLVASAGGTTAAAAASGGGGGTLAGPVGTGVGLVAGFAVGAAVDWWLTEELRGDLDGRMRGLIDRIQDVLVDGDGETPGLRQLLEQHAELLARAQTAILEGAVVGP